MRSMRSIVPCAIPSSLMGSYSTGLTSRRLDSPMFFIARMVAAMLIGFCGSKRTTTTAESSESAIVLQLDQFDHLVALATEVHELACSAAHHELTPTPLAAAGHLVDDDVQRARMAGNLDVEVIPCPGHLPLRADLLSRSPFFDGSHDHRIRLRDWNEQPPTEAALRSQVELNAVAVDERGLVIVSIHTL